MKIGIDFDDVLCPFVENACKICNLMTGSHWKKEDITKWGYTGSQAIEEVSKFYGDELVLSVQKVSDDAKLFMQELCKKGDVYIITAVKPEFMSYRASQIKKAFPEIDDSHIIMGSAKNLVQFDITLDDAAHNILKSCADFPVLFRQPWNSELSGVLSVNCYADFLVLIDQIKASFVENKTVPKEPSIVALVGPSGSNKNAVAFELMGDKFNMVTGRECIMSDAFIRTVYAGKNRAISQNAIKDSLDNGINIVVPVDMCGAMTLKNYFSNVILVFCKRSRENMIADILDRDITNDEKKIRLLSMEQEIKHQRLCDFTICTENVKDAAEKIVALFDK